MNTFADRAPWVVAQLTERQLPLNARPVMHQQWRRLLFLHWRFAPAVIQQTLPPGLDVDVYDGSAWVGIVPFAMRCVRPSGLPGVSGVPSFLELNLRTYVRDTEGRPGVWFYSLDANQPLAVWVARRFFYLPYHHAVMRLEIFGRKVRYESRRLGQSRRFVYEYSLPANSAIGEASFGSLDFFLIERYRLFAWNKKRLNTGRVYHPPYQLRSAVVESFDPRLFALEGLAVPDRSPDHVVYANRLDVTIYPVRPSSEPCPG